ncbi:TonB-dependent siderophore receptor, partial [Nitrosomonas sp.]
MPFNRRHAARRFIQPCCQGRQQSWPVSFLPVCPFVQIAAVVAGGFILSVGLSDPAAAQIVVQAPADTRTSPARQHYDIPAGPLAPALRSLASSAGLLLTFTEDQIGGKTTNGLRGQYTVQEALALLLGNSGLQVTRLTNGSYVLQKMSATGHSPTNVTLPLMTVSSQTLKQGTAEEGYRVSNISGIGLWGERSLRDTPYSISVVPSDLIENVNAQNMGQIFKMNPLTQEPMIQNFTGVPFVTIRGFLSANPVYDGIPRTGANGTAVSVIEIDRVEILSGTSGFLYGGGRVGGAINYVTKSPTDVPLRRLTFGNYGGTQFYGHADISGKFDDRGRFGYRANLLYQGGDTAIGEPVNQKVANIVLDGHLTDTLY